MKRIRCSEFSFIIPVPCLTMECTPSSVCLQKHQCPYASFDWLVYVFVPQVGPPTINTSRGRHHFIQTPLLARSSAIRYGEYKASTKRLVACITLLRQKCLSLSLLHHCLASAGLSSPPQSQTRELQCVASVHRVLHCCCPPFRCTPAQRWLKKTPTPRDAECAVVGS